MESLASPPLSLSGRMLHMSSPCTNAVYGQQGRKLHHPLHYQTGPRRPPQRNSTLVRSTPSEDVSDKGAWSRHHVANNKPCRKPSIRSTQYRQERCRQLNEILDVRGGSDGLRCNNATTVSSNASSQRSMLVRRVGSQSLEEEGASPPSQGPLSHLVDRRATHNTELSDEADPMTQRPRGASTTRTPSWKRVRSAVRNGRLQDKPEEDEADSEPAKTQAPGPMSAEANQPSSSSADPNRKPRRKWSIRRRSSTRHDGQPHRQKALESSLSGGMSLAQGLSSDYSHVDLAESAGHHVTSSDALHNATPAAWSRSQGACRASGSEPHMARLLRDELHSKKTHGQSLFGMLKRSASADLITRLQRRSSLRNSSPESSLGKDFTKSREVNAEERPIRLAAYTDGLVDGSGMPFAHVTERSGGGDRRQLNARFCKKYSIPSGKLKLGAPHPQGHHRHSISPQWSVSSSSEACSDSGRASSQSHFDSGGVAMTTTSKDDDDGDTEETDSLGLSQPRMYQFEHFMTSLSLTQVRAINSLRTESIENLQSNASSPSDGDMQVSLGVSMSSTGTGCLDK
eukprot:scpid30528/ scgid14859/ 